MREVIADFSLCERRTKKMWVQIFDVSDDWLSDNRRSTVFEKWSMFWQTGRLSGSEVVLCCPGCRLCHINRNKIFGAVYLPESSPTVWFPLALLSPCFRTHFYFDISLAFLMHKSKASDRDKNSCLRNVQSDCGTRKIRFQNGCNKFILVHD